MGTGIVNWLFAIPGKLNYQHAKNVDTKGPGQQSILSTRLEDVICF